MPTKTVNITRNKRRKKAKWKQKSRRGGRFNQQKEKRPLPHHAHTWSGLLRTQNRLSASAAGNDATKRRRQAATDTCDAVPSRLRHRRGRRGCSRPRIGIPPLSFPSPHRQTHTLITKYHTKKKKRKKNRPSVSILPAALEHPNAITNSSSWSSSSNNNNNK